MQGVHAVVHWLRRRKMTTSAAEITPEVLAAAEAHFRPREEVCSAGRRLHRFLREQKIILAPKLVRLSPLQVEANRYPRTSAVHAFVKYTIPWVLADGHLKDAPARASLPRLETVWAGVFGVV